MPSNSLDDPLSPSALDQLMTESVDEQGADLDLRSTEALVIAMNDSDAQVPIAVAAAGQQIAAAIDGVAERMARGGRLFYIGAGTPGRIGILDASEIPPTFGTDPSLVRGIIAGGRGAVFEAVENAEDDTSAAGVDLAAESLTEADSVIGLSASGRTPYVVGGLEYARSVGALTVGLACNTGSRIGAISDHAIEVVVGPEIVSGSTRLKAGSAQKSVLNMISTIVMIKLGKTYGNLMIDMRVTNHKLRARAERTVMRIADVSLDEARSALDQTGDSVKEAVVLLATGLDAEGVRALLVEHNGVFRSAISSPR